MANSIRTILSPLLILSYVFGVRVFEFPAGKPRLWVSSLYILILWLINYLLFVYIAYYYMFNDSIIYHVCIQVDRFIAILSIVLGFYYNKKFRNCLTRLIIVDNTLEELGIMTDYKKLHTKVLLVVFGWLVYIIWKTYINSVWLMNDCEPMKAVYITVILHYSNYVNTVDDLLIACIVGYVELKFDQINKYLWKLTRGNAHEVGQAWNDFVLFPHQSVFPKSNSEYVTWIVMHLHLELRRISREFNTIFGLLMTAKMGRFFAFISLSFREIFNIILINNYLPEIRLFTMMILTMLISNIFRVLFINYLCERVSVKADATGNLINRIPYCSYDIVVRESIMQFVLQLTQMPVRFYGLGLFQFGLKFLNGFCSSVATVIIILVQSHTNT